MAFGKLGKLDPVVLSGVGFISDYETTTLEPLPSVAVPAGAWAMDGNGPDPSVTNQGPNFEGVGDCTIVGVVNCDRTWNLLVNESAPIPPANNVVTEYFQLTDGQDTGLAETNVLQTWQGSGLFGTKIEAFAPVNHRKKNTIKNAVAYYGACYLGVQLPESAQQQFNVGGESTWSPVQGSPIEGGHCIVAVGYDTDGIQIVTWGQVVTCTEGWISEYVDEAYAIISQQFVEAGHGPSLDLAALKADLAAA